MNPSETPYRTPHLAEMTSPETAALDKTSSVVLIPVGAFEQHGPALPLATDQIRAVGLCDAVAQRRPDDVFIGPDLPVGVSPHHRTLPGTVSLLPETFIEVLAQYVQELHRNGWRRVMVVTGHGGNNAALGVLTQRLLRDEPDLEFAWTPITALAEERIREFGTSEVTGHCGEAETAQMLHLASELVRQDQLHPGTTSLQQLSPLPRLSRHALPHLSVTWDRLSGTGVLGDPTRATPELGADILGDAADLLSRFIGSWLSTDRN